MVPCCGRAGGGLGPRGGCAVCHPTRPGGVAAGMPETVQGLRAISGRLVSPIPVGESVRDASACFESPA